jgi:hypothetical protein
MKGQCAALIYHEDGALGYLDACSFGAVVEVDVTDTRGNDIKINVCGVHAKRLILDKSVRIASGRRDTLNRPVPLGVMRRQSK